MTRKLDSRVSGLVLIQHMIFQRKYVVILDFDLEKFIGSAGESPIINDGNSLQLSGRIGLSYLITIELYDYLVQ